MRAGLGAAYEAGSWLRIVAGARRGSVSVRRGARIRPRVKEDVVRVRVVSNRSSARH